MKVAASRRWRRILPCNGIVAASALALAACRDVSSPPASSDVVFAKAPTTASWTAIASLATPRRSFGAAVAGGKIWVIGGSSAQANVPLASVEVYDPAANVWRAGPSLPVPRIGLAASAGPDGKVYVFGGRSPPFGDPSPVVLALDPAVGVWTPVAPMPTPRDHGVAALGDDGRIYAIGGGIGAKLGPVDAYDPRGNVWSAVADLPTARTNVAAAAAADGRIYVIGGTTGARVLPTVEALTPLSGTWAPSAPLAVGREGVGAASLFGRVFIAGGSDPGAGVTASVLSYSPATNVWTSQPSLTVARRQGALVAGPDGRLYAIGGLGAAGNALGSVEAFRPLAPIQVAIDVQPGDPAHAVNLSGSGYVRVGLLSNRGVFNPDPIDGGLLRFAGALPIQLRGGHHPGKDAFDEKPIPGRRRDLNGDKKHDRIFRFPIAGLTLTPGAVRACLAGVDEHGNEFEGCGAVMTGGMPRMWAPIAPMNDVRFLTAAVADATGRVFAIGGWDGVQSEEDLVERYDATLDAWTHVAPMGQVRSGHGAALGADGLIYVAGGFDGAGALTSAQAYDPATNAWSQLPAMPHPHDETAAAASLDGRIFVMGGHDESVPNAQVEVYAPSTGTWSGGPAMPGTRYDHAVVRAPSGEIYVMGGWDSFSATVPTTTVWALDPATMTWRTLAALPAPRASAAAAVDAKGLVYLIGGNDGSNTVNTVFAYNPATNSWSQVAGMGSAREGHGAATAGDGRIIVTGGFDGALFVRTAEAFAKP